MQTVIQPKDITTMLAVFNYSFKGCSIDYITGTLDRSNSHYTQYTCYSTDGKNTPSQALCLYLGDTEVLFYFENVNGTDWCNEISIW